MSKNDDSAEIRSVFQAEMSTAGAAGHAGLARQLHTRQHANAAPASDGESARRFETGTSKN